MSPLIRPHHFAEYRADKVADPERILRGEWLVTNGLGGYASGSIAGVTTRKYHAFLVAALSYPYGRTMMLNHLSEEVVLENGKKFFLSCEERKDGQLSLEGLVYLKEFYLDFGLPVWRYAFEDFVIEKRVFLIHGQNTVHICYKLLEGAEKIQLKLLFSVHFRHHESPASQPLSNQYVVSFIGKNYQILSKPYPPLNMILYSEQATFTYEDRRMHDIFYRLEARRGYESVGCLWSPGFYLCELSKYKNVTLVASTEDWEILEALSPDAAFEAEYQRRKQLLYNAPKAMSTTTLSSELLLAADQFIISPKSRIKDEAIAKAEGEEVRTIIAGYHWFTDWGRDTMISLEGLTLCTGRQHEARWILKTFLHYVKNGLIPNMFPDREKKGLYHTADATLWFFHALDRYMTLTQDQTILLSFLPKLRQIMQFHIKGTEFGIGMDAKDVLLKQGSEDHPLTWMDAKVGHWIITPRRGKAVEINALWYNALRLMQKWLYKINEKESFQFEELANKAYQSFNQKFWIEEKQYLFDVIEGEQGNDDALRPNQLFSISLPNPILDPRHWQAVVKICQEELLTPYGLRSLARNHPDYKPTYDGDLRARDAAYHQGTVWSWLIGPFIDAWLKTFPEKEDEAKEFFRHFEKHLSEAGIGSVSEIFDAIEPCTPRGCIAQAWSVAELLRCWCRLH